MFDELIKDNYSILRVENNIIKNIHKGNAKMIAILFNKENSTKDFLFNSIKISAYEEVRIFNIDKEGKC